jgi:hypothetical protein
MERKAVREGYSETTMTRGTKKRRKKKERTRRTILPPNPAAAPTATNSTAHPHPSPQAVR